MNLGQKAIVGVLPLPLICILGGSASAQVLTTQIQATENQIKKAIGSHVVLCLGETTWTFYQKGENLKKEEDLIKLNFDEIESMAKEVRKSIYNQRRGSVVAKVSLNGRTVVPVLLATPEQEKKCDEYTP
jgi:hypothetical protein